MAFRLFSLAAGGCGIQHVIQGRQGKTIAASAVVGHFNTCKNGFPLGGLVKRKAFMLLHFKLIFQRTSEHARCALETTFSD